MADPKTVSTFQEIELPDGSIGEFPADMEPAAIERAIKQQFPETRRLEGATPQEPVAPGSFPTMSEIGRGTLRGLAGTLDLPTMGVDWAARKLGYTPEGSPHQFADLVDAYGPAPVKGYEDVGDIAEIAGPVVVEGLATGGAAVPAALAQGGARRALTTGLRTAAGATARGGAATAAGMGAGMAGGELGGMLAGETGRDVGSTVAALFGPQALGRTARGVGRSFLTDAESADRLRAAREAGVTPSMGLVGNKFAGLLEDMTVGLPFAGGPAYSMRRQQYRDMDAAGQRIAEAARGAPAAGPISEGSVGTGVQASARQALEANRHSISTAQEALAQDIGPRSPVRDVGVQDTIETMLADPTVSQEVKDTLRQRRDQMIRDRTTIIDPNEAADIQRGQTRVSNWEAAMRRAAGQGTPVTPGQSRVLDQMETRIEQERALLARRLDENTGTTYGATKDLRSNLGRQTADSVPLPTKLTDPLYGATTDAMRTRAVESGVPAQRFDEVQADTRLRSGENERLQPLVDQANEGSSYNQLFSSRNEQNVSLLDILNNRAPTPLAQTLADQLELRTRGTSAGGPVNPETVNPREIANWWGGLDEGAKDIHAAPGTPERTQMDALADVASADIRRPTRALPGKGGNTIGMPLVFGLSTSGIGGSIGSGSILPALLAAAPSVIARGIGGAMTSPRVTSALVDPPRPFLDPGNILPAIQALRGSVGPPR